MLIIKVPFSITIIFTSSTLAFSTFIRVFLSLIFDLAWTKFIISTGIYAFWDQFLLNFDSQKLAIFKRDTVSKWKEEARIAKLMKEEMKLKKDEEKKKKQNNV
jgi:hypothetical protein